MYWGVGVCGGVTVWGCVGVWGGVWVCGGVGVGGGGWVCGSVGYSGDGVVEPPPRISYDINIPSCHIFILLEFGVHCKLKN